MNVKEFFNSIAPRWDAAETHTEHDLRPFVDLCDIRPTDKVLDLGCGTGIISRLLAEKGQTVTGLDVSDEMIALAKIKYADRADIRFICADFYDFDGGKFDYAVVFNAYPHFCDRQKFVAKLYDVLTDNGGFAIMHNIGRQTLAAHHKNVSEISRTLLPVEQEKRCFEGLFDITAAEESDAHYLIKGAKKCNR